jgi:(p)ppGpp synthase/HD superfamily hydrolase
MEKIIASIFITRSRKLNIINEFFKSIVCKNKNIQLRSTQENQVGLLNRIAIIFSRRKINIESLNTSPSQKLEVFIAFTIVINEFEDVMKKLVRQNRKASGSIEGLL